MSDPPFRADHVGSLLRPPELLRARSEHQAGRLAAAELRRIEDGQLVATALQHRLTFATRNVRHVSETGVVFVNPF